MNQRQKSRTKRNVGHQVRRSLPWIAAEALVNVLYGVGMVGVIGWLISPQDFGAASAALATVYLIETFSKAGIQESIIRESSTTTKVTDAAHAASMVLAVVAIVVVWALAAPLASTLGDLRTMWFIWAASFIIPLNALVAAPLGILTRKMRAAQIVRRQITSKIVSMAVIVAGALLGEGAWAIILASIVVPLVSYINIHLMMTRFPRWRWDWDITKRLIKFGFAISAEAACWNMMTRAFSLMFGYFHGMAELGALQLALRLVDEVANLVKLAVTRLGLSAFAALERSGANIGATFEKGTTLINIVSAPVFALLAMTAAPVMPVLFGAKWAPAVPYVQVFAVSWLVAMPRILLSPALRAIGRQYLQLAYAGVSAVVALGGVMLVGHMAPIIAGVAYAARQLVSIPWGMWTVRRLFNITVLSQIMSLLPAFAAALIMSAVVAVVLRFTPHISMGLRLPAVIVAALACYLPSIYLMNRRGVMLLVSVLRGKKN